jgi:spermidine synthase
MNQGLRLLALATVLSGAASWIHGTVWMRFLVTELGPTGPATLAVLAAALTGLALGARLCGPMVDRRRRTVPVYILIEVGICVFGLGTGLLLHHLRASLPVLLGHSTGVALVPRAFATTLAFVLLPTFFMGATFPVVMATCRRLGANVDGMVRLYGLGLLGSAAGIVACAGYAIPTFGVIRTMLWAGGLNLLAALLCLPLLSPEKAAIATAGHEAPAPATEPQVGWPAWLCGVSVLSGTAILALAVMGSRITTFTLGDRTFAFSALLGWILVLLACGAWVSRRLWRRFADRITWLLALLLLASAGGILLSVTLANAWILAPEALARHLPHSPTAIVLVRILGLGLLMSFFLIPLGCLFPTGLGCLRGSESRTGELAGQYRMWNTLGSVTGALVAGVVVIPALGAFACAALVALVCALGALAVCAPLARTRVGRWRGLVGVGGGVVALIAIPLLMPGQIHVFREGEQPVLRVEDAWGVFQVFALPDGRQRVMNNRTQLAPLLGDFSTSYVQEMQAHIASFLRPSSRTALVLGGGYGITAGALTTNPRIEHIDVVESLPAMAAAADRFQPYNRAYHRNPRVRIVVDDGRHFLANSQDTYDIVSLDIADAHLPRAAGLLSADFYQALKCRLGDGGIVVQHAFGMDADIVLSTLKHSFRYLRAFPAERNAFNVAASDNPLRPTQDEVERLAAIPSVGGALAQIGMLPPIRSWQMFSRGLPPSALSDLIAPNLVSTDDRPLLEFSHRDNPSAWVFSTE